MVGQGITYQDCQEDMEGEVRLHENGRSNDGHGRRFERVLGGFWEILARFKCINPKADLEYLTESNLFTVTFTIPPPFFSLPCALRIRGDPGFAGQIKGVRSTDSESRVQITV
jgi:hypothetical protein